MIDIKNAVLRNTDLRFREPVSLDIEQGEHLAFVGSNGSGKSVLAQMITGKYPLRDGFIVYETALYPLYKNIKFIAFKDSYGPADSTYYLQQRWNSQDSEDSPLVRDVLGDLSRYESAFFGDNCQNEPFNRVFTLFEIDKMLDKQIVMLSSGEMRKFQLTRTLLTRPRILIIDNPFIGLDVVTRGQLCDLLGELAQLNGLQIILLLSATNNIPDFITHIVPIDNMGCGEKVKYSDYKPVVPEMPFLCEFHLPATMYAEANSTTEAYTDEQFSQQSPFPCYLNRQPEKIASEPLSDAIIDMRNVTVRYGQHTILDSLNWTVRRGEKWSLLGKNGSGKSTLLSLICADNPQGYACDISLFGSRRGTGESIWEIKKRIGYVSPEMHRSYSENIPTINIVASGLHDSIGLYVRPRPEQFVVCEWWMNLFGILHLKDRMFLQLSDGEQRMVLLVRAFVKDPELLILDEPMHGLDVRNRLLVQSIIESFCFRPDKTLIMVTHYENELPECVNKTLVLKRVN